MKKQKMVTKKKYTLIIKQFDKRKNINIKDQGSYYGKLYQISGYINNKKILPSNQAYAKAARNITKIRVIGESQLEEQIKDPLIQRLNKRPLRLMAKYTIHVNLNECKNQMLHHFNQSKCHEEKTGMLLIHTESNAVIPYNKT